MRWAARQRMGFIKASVERGEPLNRCDLVKEFGVSTQTAAADIANYRALFPGTLKYDTSLKAYVPLAIATLDAIINAGGNTAGCIHAIDSNNKCQICRDPRMAELEEQLMGDASTGNTEEGNQPADTTSPATQAYQQVREALEYIATPDNSCWYCNESAAKAKQALAAMPALLPVERGEGVVDAIESLRITKDVWHDENVYNEALDDVVRIVQQRTTEPVSVSLGDCGLVAASEYCVIHDLHIASQSTDQWKQIAKAVLDSAKQQGACFDYVE